MVWNDLIQEVMGKKNQQVEEKKVVRKKYQLGELYDGIAFSRREAETMVLLTRGKTAAEIANNLELSSRTIEFYMVNMKRKLNVRTKSKLIELVLASDFMKNIDFSFCETA